MKEKNLGYGAYNNCIIVSHLMAKMECEKEITTEFQDYEEYIDVVKSIVDDWTHQVDIRDEEEMGYISAYAQRILRETFF